ncbi:MAG: transglutaminase domain-containing protein [Bacilli bacterium]|nr:transglutaminase domain-containing protein [Bacilli bacterium]
MRKIISLLIIIIGGWYLYNHDTVQNTIKDMKKEITIPTINAYKKDLKVNYVKNVDYFRPNSKIDLINIYYTVINSGWEEFTFYCGEQYDKCINDVEEISANNHLLSHLNSFVHPYNSYQNLYTTYHPKSGKVTLNVFRNYDEYLIEIIDKRIDEILTEITTSQNKIREKIKLIHDYLINNNEYDTLKMDDINDNTYHSNIAYGPLFQGYAVCSGYTDAMALFLTELNIPNIKIATNNHVWNLVYLDNKWWHLDLTWNSPLGEKKTILDDYFLINTEKLNSYDNNDHKFDLNIYQEAK